MTVSTDLVLKIVILVALSIFGSVIHHLSKRYTYWKVRNVPHVAGVFNDFIFSKETQTIWYENIYRKYTNFRYVGVYLLGKPALLIRDPHLIQRILLKDFNHFVDKHNKVDENLDPLLCSLPHLQGERWKNIRAKFSELFSSGKLKDMFPLLEKCTELLDRRIEKAAKISDEVEIFSFCSKFSIDVVGVCAYGLDFKAIKDNSLQFRRIARKEFVNPFKAVTKRVLEVVNPKIVSWLKLRTLDRKMEDFIFSFTRTLMENQEKEPERMTFTQMMANLKKREQSFLESQADKSEPLITETVTAAAALSFLVGGTNNVALVLTFCMYELAVHPDVMEKLYQEITRVKNAHGKLDYSALQEMRYLDSVVKETMRLNSASKELTRICTKPYNIPGSSLFIEKNTIIKVPISALSVDPEYFPEPNKFDPDRFDEENMHKIIPGTFLPFGQGRRSCLALRFAKMELKIAVAYIVGKYTIHPTKRTEKATSMKPNASFTAPLNKIYLRFQKRGE